MRESKSLAQSGIEHAMEIIYNCNHQKEMILFDSEQQKQEWVGKIQKIQSIGNLSFNRISTV